MPRINRGNRKKVTIYLTDEVLALLKALADIDEEPLATLIRRYVASKAKDEASKAFKARNFMLSTFKNGETLDNAIAAFLGEDENGDEDETE